MSLFHLRTAERQGDDFILHLQNDGDASVVELDATHPRFTKENRHYHTFPGEGVRFGFPNGGIRGAVMEVYMGG